jgi:hypothetical protein
LRAILVAGAVLALAGTFGLGVVVGRFVLKDERPAAAALEGVQPLPPSDPNLDAQAGLDPALDPPAPPTPLPPALPPGSGATAARVESEAAMAAGAAACNVRVTRRMPIRTWASGDRLVASAAGATCGGATVRLIFEGPDGGALYTLSAAAADFGLSPQATADELRAALDRAMPDSAVRAAAYPAWSEATPAVSEFTREAYDAIRAANNPVVCVKLPTAPQRCVAADPATGEVKVFNRG